MSVLADPDIVSVPPLDLSAPVVYLPVRHHSPACARQVRRVIEQIRPDAVLIEGPRNASHLIPLVIDRATRPPVAIYCTAVEFEADGQARHHGAYYPLCDYSPEYQAILAAETTGSRSRFIDLSYPEQVAAGRRRTGPELPSLHNEARLAHSRFLKELARRAGARDHDDLWDHLFEAADPAMDPADFFHGVLTYCACSRADETDEALAADGTLAREACMAQAIDAERQAGARRIVVVTGGFHTVALPNCQPADIGPTPAPDETAIVQLMRYRFDLLDALNGYGAGMPAPDFYQRCWDGEDHVAMLVELARSLRADRGEPAPADAVAAAAFLDRITRLRGHAQPTREDLLDAVRSHFIKGSIDIEGVRTLAECRRFFTGNRVGAVCDAAGQPPLLRQALARCAELGISTSGLREERLSLDPYRKQRDRAVSRFFFALNQLQVPLAQRQAGPDYVSGSDTERMREIWTYRWQPGCDAALITAARYGATVDEAVAARLVEGFAALGSGAAAGAVSDGAAGLILEAARCGAHAVLEDFCRRSAALFINDGEPISLARACQRLQLARHACDPLELHQEQALADLLPAAWDRLGTLLPALGRFPEDRDEEGLEALMTWRQVADELAMDRDDAHAVADASERAELLADLSTDPDGNPFLAGAALGLVHGDGACAEALVAQRVQGRLVTPLPGARFLAGLLRTARALCWQSEALARALDGLLDSADEAVFLEVLPHLRLAFSDLTPRECDQVAALVGGLHGQARWRAEDFTTVDPASTALAAAISQRLVDQTQADGQEPWW